VFPGCVFQLELEPLVEQGPIGGPRERVVVGEVVQLFRLVDAIEGERGRGPASSASRRISWSSKNPTSAAYRASAPTASSLTIRGMTASELMPRSSSSLRISLCGSLFYLVRDRRELGADCAPPRDRARPACSRAPPWGRLSKKSRTSSGKKATGFTSDASRSTTPIQAMTKRPASTAMRPGFLEQLPPVAELRHDLPR